MKYIILLRGINVGTSVQIKMSELKVLLEENGYTNVSTYINSGNILLTSEKSKSEIKAHIENILESKYGEKIPAVVKTPQELQQIAAIIPAEWTNDEFQKTDVAFLFDTADSGEIEKNLPVKREYVRIITADGVIIWNVSRENYNKSQLNKIISHKIYKQMTVRNVNTARKLALMQDTE